VENDRWLDPAKVSKVRRSDIYRILALSVPSVACNALIRMWGDRLIARIEARMSG
jgi:farnesyl-diphosphate farnesyltransferase